ncbi:MAG TPA: YhjD/YihY/BrkB family envelope integrity protein [Acidimicrobiales bacterium]|nr:YhjD/YihY/BrkB family envelope integrity protein [Acidimicrobiales bacterium]
MGALKGLVGWVDRWQRRNPVPGAGYGVIKKFSDDQANLLVVSLGWYGFTAIFPLLLVVVTIFGFVGQKSLGNGIVNTLHQFPVVGANFNPAGASRLHGSILGLVIGVVGLLYGAQGVTQTAQTAMASVWNIPQYERTGFLPRLGRSLGGLFTIGGAFVINAFASTYATGANESFAIRVPVIAALLVLNVGFYYAAFRILTPKMIGTRCLLPGSIGGAVAFTLLITVGTGLLTHELKNTSNTYGTFGSVIGVVTFLLLLAKLSIYAAELNPVLKRSLYPRAMPFGEPTDADRRVLRDLAHQERREEDQRIGVGFGPDPSGEAAADARGDDGTDPDNTEAHKTETEETATDGHGTGGSWQAGSWPARSSTGGQETGGTETGGAATGGAWPGRARTGGAATAGGGEIAKAGATKAGAARAAARAAGSRARSGPAASKTGTAKAGAARPAGSRARGSGAAAPKTAAPKTAAPKTAAAKTGAAKTGADTPAGSRARRSGAAGNGAAGSAVAGGSGAGPAGRPARRAP